MSEPVTRSYDPTTEHVIRCACGLDTFPFPHPDSPTCPVCWFLARMAERGEVPA
jgi:hypothetical protein